MTPITRDEFNAGRKTLQLERTIHQFLATHRGQAFTIQEIGRSIGLLRGTNFITDLAGLGQLNPALRALIQEKKVISRSVGLEQYYTVP